MSAEGKSLPELARSVRADATLRGAFDREYSGPGDASSALDLVADETALAPPAEYAQLARLAFDRPDPAEADAQARAVRELERLAADRDAVTVSVRRALLAVVDRPAGPELSSAPKSGHALAILAVVLVALVGTVAGALLMPVPSLAVFDRTQTAEEERLGQELVSMFSSHEIDLDSVRMLASDDETVFLAASVSNVSVLSTGELGVCLFSLTDDGGGGACSPLDDVRTTGLSGSSSTPSSRVTYSWGPTGPLVFTRTNRDNSP